ncbi:hypothetical protein XELAEV_180027822mg, partial [Xenopus laevis]
RVVFPADGYLKLPGELTLQRVNKRIDSAPPSGYSYTVVHLQ